MMPSFPQFLLESSICLALFYAFYYWILRKETFFQVNRVYLLLTPLCSILIPLINIDIRPLSTTAINATTFESFIYPTISNTTAVNDLVWQTVFQPTPSFSFTIADVLLAIYAIGAIWMATRLILGLMRLSRLIASSQQRKEDGYTVVETVENIPAASFFSYVFWNEDALADKKRLILEHELVHIRQHHSLDVILIELYVILKWYNPLIYLYRNSLQTTHEYIADRFVSRQADSVHQYASLLVQRSHQQTNNTLFSTFSALVKKRLIMLGQGESSLWRSLKYFLSIPILVGLMLLFSFNLVEEIPENPISESLYEFNDYLEDLGRKTILEIDKKAPYEHYLEWGGVEVPLLMDVGDCNYAFDMRQFEPKAFDKIIEENFILKQAYTQNDITSFWMGIETEKGEVYIIENNYAKFVELHQQLKEEYTLFLRLNDEEGLTFLSVISITEQQGFYNENLSHTQFIESDCAINLQLRVCMGETINKDDLQIIPQSIPYLEWGNRQIQAIQAGSDLEAPIDIQTIPLAEFKSLSQQNFNLQKEGSCLLIDSVFTMVRGEGEDVFRCTDQWDEGACYRDFLEELDAPATIYLVLKTAAEEVYSSIFSVGKTAVLEKDSEDFVTNLLQYPTPKFNLQSNKIANNQYVIHWNDLRIITHPASIEKKDIPVQKIDINEFRNALNQRPYLSLNEGNIFDDLELKIITPVHTGRYYSYLKFTKEKSNTSIKEYLEEWKLDLKPDNIYYLSDISHGKMMPDRIMAAIQLTGTDRTPRPKKIALKAENSYQFHWGKLDTKLTKKTNKKYTAKIEVPINEFKESLSLEPVLTSKENGVFYDFHFVLNGDTIQEKFHVIINQPEVYYESFNKAQIVDEIAVGDQLQISTFQAEGIKDELTIQINIVAPSVDNSKKYKDGAILDWGDYVFDIRQLNTNSTNDIDKLITLSPEFFNSIRCTQPKLFFDNKELKIGEASIIVKNRHGEYTCDADDWNDWSCIMEHLEGAKEEAQVSFFFKTKAKKNYQLRFTVAENEIEQIEFGKKDSPLFIELQKEYATTFYQATPSIHVELKGKSVRLKWGNWDADLFLNPIETIIRSNHRIDTTTFYENLEADLWIEIDGQPTTLSKASFMLFSNFIEDIELECFNGKCRIHQDDIERIKESFRGKVSYDENGQKNIRFFNHILSLERSINGKNQRFSTHYFEPEMTARSWRSDVKIKPIPKDGVTFPFQMIHLEKGGMILRMDTENERYKWLLDSYKDNPSVEIIHVPDFKTVVRVIGLDDRLVPKERIKTVEVLARDVKDIYQYPEYHEFKDTPYSFYWNGIAANLIKVEEYNKWGRWIPENVCLEDFLEGEGDAILSIKDTPFEIVQFDLFIIPDKGDATKFISNTTKKKEIKKAIRCMDERTNVVFQNILFKDAEGRIMRFPMSLNYSLE